MVTPPQPQRTTRRHNPFRPHRRAPFYANRTCGSQQQPLQVPSNLQSPQSQGNQVLPLAVRPAPRKRRFSWFCCGSYERAAAIWGCLAVVSPLAFFLLEWTRQQDDPYAKATYGEARYQSDIEAKRLCVALKAAQLPSSHLDCDRILSSSFPARYEILESAVGQVKRHSHWVQSSMLTILILVRDFLSNNCLFSALAICVLAAILALAMSAGRSVKAPPIIDPKTKHMLVQDASFRGTSAGSSNHGDNSDEDPFSSPHPRLSASIPERATNAVHSSSDIQPTSENKMRRPEAVHTQKSLVGVAPTTVNDEELKNLPSTAIGKVTPLLPVAASKTVSAAPATTIISPMLLTETSSSNSSSPPSTWNNLLLSSPWKRSPRGSGSRRDEEVEQTATASPSSAVSSVRFPSWETGELDSSYKREQPKPTGSRYEEEKPILPMMTGLLSSAASAISYMTPSEQHQSWLTLRVQKPELFEPWWSCCACGQGPHRTLRTPQCLCSHSTCSNCPMGMNQITEALISLLARPSEMAS
ncbi:hypothetical protein F5144DRAFT_559539 [Chaetomium tenue]|uniref:Uncharacterized protein n=1 Tax=Chaetomium tenue TaxID=1854479 RepID=A0ACB7PDZ8_9PEZI|nr:hypothetical protein F5144DRAFT_559539 [Chaetomium globosum]